MVYNRYGQLVSENIDSGWDGTYKGQKADAGVYFYVIEYRTDMGLKQIKGTVEVVK
ncbi:MAG: gliding motility-associated C-terminal domain-containing protein [Paludibacteraceae bacterium]|nr:gliding motility-associated C-terminal domain-containing protein [Paludibacteraceae bacterium]MBN2788450.1 gliding motility-associated C-terminal domain-containing protein [Paludibacteraceae bacterium]